ncbi:MAG: ABC transporter permease [Anaerolineae bacterium]|nr:ABC transporter permease [Anaerolineae bacterium]
MTTKTERQTHDDVPLIRFGPEQSLFDLELGDLWRQRELLYFLVLRDIKIRYKQTALGIGWAILQPFLTMVIFTAIFGVFVKVPSNGQPYPIFAYTALLPWNLFAQGVARGSTGLVDNAQLITKVFFPRLILPLAAVIAPAVDFVIAFVFLLGMMAWYRLAPTVGLLWLPAFVLLALLTALAVSLWLAAINVRYRDVRHAIPFLLQFWMYASPVAYPLSIVPERWRGLYSLNPMVAVIEGFRWALLGGTPPAPGLVAPALVLVALLLGGGLLFFKRMERTFADVI